MQQCLRVRKRKRRERKEKKRPPKHRFKSICVFNEFDVVREVEFIVATSELGNILVIIKINYVCKRNPGLKKKCDDFNMHEREPNLKCLCKGAR